MSEREREREAGMDGWWVGGGWEAGEMAGGGWMVEQVCGG